MIVFDLKCAKGHTFEGWFDDRSEFESEKSSGRLTCPICADNDIVIQPSGGFYSKGRNEPARSQTSSYKTIADYLKKNFDNVGPNFAEEAIKIHFGETEIRNIHGSMTSEEEAELNEEGVEYFKIPTRKLQS